MNGTKIVAIRPEDAAKYIRPSDMEVVTRAREALAAFHRLRPQLAAFARVLTGNPTVTVMPTGGAPATDGQTIYIKPNLGLGDHRRHPDPRVCQDREPHTGLLACDACREHEEIMVSLLHEIGHIVYDSFEAMDDHEKERAVERALEEAERAGVSRHRMQGIRESFAALPPKNYIEAAARISPFMPMLLNALEDARVNDLTIKARPGMKIMFAASDARIFNRGVEGVDGSITKWADCPPNAQILIGTFIIASGVEVQEGWLSGEVTDDLSDPELLELLEQVREAPSVRDVYKVAFPILERLRALGYCLLDKEQDDEPDSVQGDATPDQQDTDGDDDDEGDQQEPSQGPSQSDPFGDSDEESEPGDDSESDDEGSADTAASDEGEEGDEGEPEPDENPDNENGQGGDWNSQERDDLGEGDEEELDDDGDLGDDEIDDDDADASAATGTSGDDDDPDTADEDGAHASDDDADDPDPTDDDDASTDDPRASDDDDADDDDDATDDDDWDDDDDWGDDEHAQEGNEDGDPNEQQEGEQSESYNDKGAPDDVQDLLKEFGGHSHDDDPPTPEDKAEEEAIDRAIEQDKYFEQPSDFVSTVNEHEYKDGAPGFGIDPVQGKVEVDERNIQSAVVPMRKAFAANKQGSMTRNLRSGRVNGRSLAKRVPVGDDRMFQKRRRPSKRDYHVVIGIDMSGSVAMRRGRRTRILSAAYMQAELCARVGVPFEVWAHTGCMNENRPVPTGANSMHSYAYPWQVSLEMYKIKGYDEPWTDHTRDRLWAIMPHEVNIDGHTMEFYRKRLDTTRATDKLLIYYTDGEMPNFNYEEELAILQRELGEFRKRNYSIMGVGIDTDSPKDHGLDTVAVYNDADIKKVVMELEKRLA